MKKIMSKQKVLTLSIGMLLGANHMAVNATQYDQAIIASGGTGINLTADDTVNVSDAGSPIVGVESKSAGATVNADGTHITVTNEATVGSAEGLHLENNVQTNTINNAVINVNANSGAATGVVVDGSSTKVVGSNNTINATAKGDATGVEAAGGSTVEIQGGSITVDSGATSYGAVYARRNSQLTADGVKMNIKSNDGYGAVADAGSTLDLGTGSEIHMDSAGSSDVALKTYGAVPNTSYTKSTVTADHLTIDTNHAMGVFVQEGSDVNLGTGSSITTGGEDMYGVWVNGQGSTFEAKDVNVESKGLRAHAIYAQNGAAVNIAEGSKVVAALGHALFAETQVGVIGNAEQGASSVINFIGTAAKRNQIENKYLGAATAYHDGAVINVENTDIKTDGNANDWAAGLYAAAKGVVNAKNVAITNNENSYATEALDGGAINLSGETTINAASATEIGSALLAVNTGKAEAGQATKLMLTGKANITGNIAASGENTEVDIDATAGSVITGFADKDGDSAIVNMKLTDGTWNATENSNVNELILNGGTLDFAGKAFETLTADTLEGSGQINSKVDIVGKKADLVVVKGAANGDYKMKFTNNGAAKTDGSETVTVVKTGENNANFSLANKVELGGYAYDLRAVEDAPNDVELYSTGLAGPADAASSFINISYLTNYIENQTLLQRLGDLRNNNQLTAENSGVWLKGFGGKLSSFADTELSGFDMSYTGMQLGADTQLDNIDSGKVLVGMMAGYTNVNPHYSQGSGKGKSYSLGYYATYLADDGLYVDSVLKFSHMKNHFNIADTEGVYVSGTGKTSGVSLSAEVGKRFWFNGAKDGFYVEPQAQMTYGFQTHDTVKASNGLNVGLSHYNIALGRASVVAGYQVSDVTPLNVYAKVGVLREFAGKASYNFNEMKDNRYSFRSNWFESGVGLNMTFAKLHNIYAELDYANGSKFDKKHVDIGYRYSF